MSLFAILGIKAARKGHAAYKCRKLKGKKRKSCLRRAAKK